MKDVVLCVLHYHVQPFAQVRGDHMHHTEPRYHSVAVLLYQLQCTDVLHTLLVTQLATNLLNVNYRYHKSAYPKSAESNLDLRILFM
jgi:hypothetical protein